MITDVNDNDPTIPSPAPDVSLPETTTGGNVIFTYVPEDLDASPMFTFVLNDDGGPFTMNGGNNMYDIS